MDYLIQLEQRALELQREGRPNAAIDLFKQIVEIEPDWEHGGALYSLATCYEDIGEYALAEQYYVKAVHHDPSNLIFLSGYASFLFVHGDCEEALKIHQTLLEAGKLQKNVELIQKCYSAISALQQKAARRKAGENTHSQ